MMPDAYSPTSSRWNSNAFYHPSKSRTNVLPTKGGHFLREDPYVYDAAFFNITAAEAVALDPKQRMAMEVTYEALENANLSLQDIWGTQTTCYIGSTVSDYRDALIRDFMQNPKYHLLGTGEEMISNRISHFLNIHGPSATVTTACSSSLMATHMAVQSIKSGEADMAITGGVGLMLTPDYTTVSRKSFALSFLLFHIELWHSNSHFPCSLPIFAFNILTQSSFPISIYSIPDPLQKWNRILQC